MEAVVKTLPTPRSKSRANMIPIVNNQFSWFQPFYYKSNKHKQHLMITKSKNFHCLSQFLIRKSKKFFSLDQPATMNSTHPHIPLPKHIFLTAHERYRENISISGATEENLESTFLHGKFLFPWFTSETKRLNLRLTCVHHPWIKPEKITKIRFQQ